jgi:hypothetical protein
MYIVLSSLSLDVHTCNAWLALQTFPVHHRGVCDISRCLYDATLYTESGQEQGDGDDEVSRSTVAAEEASATGAAAGAAAGGATGAGATGAGARSKEGTTHTAHTAHAAHAAHAAAAGAQWPDRLLAVADLQERAEFALLQQVVEHRAHRRLGNSLPALDLMRSAITVINKNSYSKKFGDGRDNGNGNMDDQLGAGDNDSSDRSSGSTGKGAHHARDHISNPTASLPSNQNHAMGAAKEMVYEGDSDGNEARGPTLEEIRRSGSCCNPVVEPEIYGMKRAAAGCSVGSVAGLTRIAVFLPHLWLEQGTVCALALVQCELQKLQVPRSAASTNERDSHTSTEPHVRVADLGEGSGLPTAASLEAEMVDIELFTSAAVADSEILQLLRQSGLPLRLFPELSLENFEHTWLEVQTALTSVTAVADRNDSHELVDKSLSKYSNLVQYMKEFDLIFTMFPENLVLSLSSPSVSIAGNPNTAEGSKQRVNAHSLMHALFQLDIQQQLLRHRAVCQNDVTVATCNTSLSVDAPTLILMVDGSNAAETLVVTRDNPLPPDQINIMVKSYKPFYLVHKIVTLLFSSLIINVI